MKTVRWGLAVCTAVALSGVAPGGTAAQDADVQNRIVAKQLSISQSDASMHLELEDGRSLEITFRDGAVSIDGETVGTFDRGDQLESSWRKLLSSTVDATEASLAELLAQWDTPEELDGQEAETASLLDATLEEFVAGQIEAAVAANVSATVEAAVSQAVTAEANARSAAQLGIPVRELLRSRDLLNLLDQLGDLDLDLDEVRASVGEDLTIHRGETTEGDVFVFGGDLDVRGEIDGNVVVADGRVRLFEEGLITGDLRLADATFHDYGGTLVGRRSRVRASRSDEFDRMRDELREELRTEIRDELESELHDSYDWRPRGGLFHPFRHFWAGLMGLFQTVLTFGILSAIGAVLLYFQPKRLADVVETARTSPMKSAAVGLASSFLFVPAWVIGIVVLTISIVGIPALLLWVPLFPLAMAFAALFGTFAVMTVVGEWAQRRHFRFMEWADDPNAFYRMVSGLLAVSALFAGAHVLRMGGPLLGFFHGLLAFLAFLVASSTVVTGLGAALLTFSNRRSVYVNNEYGEDWTWREWARPRSWKGGAAASAGAEQAAAAAADMAEGAAEAVDDVVDAAAEATEDVVDAADDITEDVMDAAADMKDEVVEAAAEDAEAAADAADETIEDIKDALDDLGDDRS